MPLISCPVHSALHRPCEFVPQLMGFCAVSWPILPDDEVEHIADDAWHEP